MRVLIQRVTEASVEIEHQIKSSIGKGLLVFVGIEITDSLQDAEKLAGKTAALRIFDDERGIMNLSVTDIDGEVLVVSQFTLCAETRKGNRPSYINAAGHEKAIPLYESFCKIMEQKTGKEVKTGVFAADMKVKLVNDGPVTIWIDSKVF
ncbi:D-aminoacyl-tRNA deacylase [Porphyromonadaceae sp. NP-X]|jgi:D-tyrosyl-tRNA(Tyr) deacylase|nr:D-tyrosyl-tRNA(Tyr) deacylase [Paludibacteraceae bacterium]MDS1033032.1 D-aminoacyl-tRNA deacylase [Porphyromonadaceae sp. NP-X]